MVSTLIVTLRASVYSWLSDDIANAIAIAQFIQPKQVSPHLSCRNVMIFVVVTNDKPPFHLQFQHKMAKVGRAVYSKETAPPFK